MQRLTDFLAMGCHTVFVWPAYGVTILVMAGLVVRSLRRYRRGQRELEMLQRDQPWRNPRGALGA
jgi:heme exporter protein D